MKAFRLALLVAVTLAFLTLDVKDARAAGFEVPENTTRSVARGGTGALSKRDPSALYFNPALLPRSDGFQVLLDVNLVGMDASFQRDDFFVESRDVTREFQASENQRGFFPAPFLALSYDFGIDDLGVAIGAFGPSAYGRRCYTEVVDGECAFDLEASAKHMILASDLLQIYFTAGVGYTFDLGPGELSIGAAGALAYQNLEFSLVLDEVLIDGTFDEAPDNQSPFTGTNLTDIKPTGFFGVVYHWKGLRVGASYRPPINWEAEGDFEIEFPEVIADLARIEGDQTLNFETKQAGSLRAGIQYEHGVHPGVRGHPLFDIEFNLVWEDWSRLEYFRIAPAADLFIGSSEQTLNPVFQPKFYRDTYSFRLGGSYGALSWMTAHLGASYETAAQQEELTNADFLSWDRTTVGGGLSLHLVDYLDIDLGYAYTFMPDRSVSNGEVYQPIPFSGCVGPDYQGEACQNPGTPPGNPQNEGEWSASFQIISFGLTYKLD